MVSRAILFDRSTTEGLPVAKAPQTGLAEACDVTLWNQGIFQPSFRNCESLDLRTLRCKAALWPRVLKALDSRQGIDLVPLAAQTARGNGCQG